MPDEHIKFTNYSWSSLIKRAHNLTLNNSNETKMNWSNNVNVKIRSILGFYRGKECFERKEDESLFSTKVINSSLKLKL